MYSIAWPYKDCSGTADSEQSASMDFEFGRVCENVDPMLVYYIYREGNTIKLWHGTVENGKERFGNIPSRDLGTRPLDTLEKAERYQQRWQTNVNADPTCKPPYSADKD